MWTAMLAVLQWAGDVYSWLASKHYDLAWRLSIRLAEARWAATMHYHESAHEMALAGEDITCDLCEYLKDLEDEAR